MTDAIMTAVVYREGFRAEGDGVVHPVGDGGYYLQGFFVVMVGYVQCGAGVRIMCPGPPVSAFIDVPAHSDIVGLQYARNVVGVDAAVAFYQKSMHYWQTKVRKISVAATAPNPAKRCRCGNI